MSDQAPDRPTLLDDTTLEIFSELVEHLSLTGKFAFLIVADPTIEGPGTAIDTAGNMEPSKIPGLLRRLATHIARTKGGPLPNIGRPNLHSNRSEAARLRRKHEEKDG